MGQSGTWWERHTFLRWFLPLVLSSVGLTFLDSVLHPLVSVALAMVLVSVVGVIAARAMTAPASTPAPGAEG